MKGPGSQLLRSGLLATIVLIVLALAACGTRAGGVDHAPELVELSVTPLPVPRLEGPLSLEEALRGRRSVRAFTDTALTLDEIGQLLWAAQGITDPRGYRTAPSAGALYPLEVYAVTPEGVFHYEPVNHALVSLSGEDVRGSLAAAALGQQPILDSPLILTITAVFERTEVKYGSERGPRYVYLEAGHAAQNVLLEAVALGLGAVPIGAFDDAEVMQVLGLPPDHLPLYLIPVGNPR
jgi:SagB-type dehydrogenase family enzyme